MSLLGEELPENKELPENEELSEEEKLKLKLLENTYEHRVLRERNPRNGRRFDENDLKILQEELQPEKVKEKLTEMKTAQLTMNDQTYTLNSLCNDKDMENELIDEGYLPETERGSLFPCPEDRNYVVNTTTALGQGGLNTVYKTTNNLVFKLNQGHVEKDAIERLARGAYIQALLNKKCGKYIVKILDVGTMKISSRKYGAYSIMEQFNTDMFNYIKQQRKQQSLSTPEFKKIFYDIFLGLKCINEAGFVHRDIKKENIGIIINEDRPIEAKIFDFDFIVHIENKEEILLNVGTPGFQDPTIINGRGCNIKSDIYSVGVMLYEHFANAIVRSHWDINLKKIQYDNDLKDLISSCTQRNPKSRCDAKTALNNPWFSELYLVQDTTYDDVDREFKLALAVEQQTTEGGKTKKCVDNIAKIKKTRSKNKYTKKLIKKRRTNKNKK
jgi:serine/threonine protein kinase